MIHRIHRSIHRPFAPLLAALLLAVGVAQPADAQRRGEVRSFADQLVGGLRDLVAGPPPEERAPRGVRACGSLYGPEARDIARGPEWMNSYEHWIRSTTAVVDEFGPLPVCFDYGSDTLTSNQGRFLLNVNNEYLRRHRDAGFVLTGYSDPVERSPVLALRRAEEIRLQSVGGTCRYLPRRGSASVSVELYRKVEYSLDPAANRCRRPSPSR